MSEWRDIETASKDGRHVLVAWAGTFALGCPHVEACYWGGAAWHYSHDGDSPPLTNPPTHWQPLEPPRG